MLIAGLGVLAIAFFTPFLTAKAQHTCLGLLTKAQEIPGRSSSDGDSILFIPVVVHVLYKDTFADLPKTRIANQIRHLTEDFRRLNADRSMTPAVFQSVAADCKIEFCLTAFDPDSNATSGITRTQTFVDEIGLSEKYYTGSLGGHDAWDSDRFLNIWVCEIALDGSVSGFANPASNQEKKVEGVVVDYRYFGLGEPALAPFDGGRTLTHEVGHWLGLKHLWGDQIDCDEDDGITDTPLQFDRYRSCPSHPQLSCGSQDMFMNFMDLTDDACMNIFTRGQKERMRETLLALKPKLWSTTICDSQSTSTTETELLLQIFPNPTSGFIQWSEGGDMSRYKIKISNSHGSEIPFVMQSNGVSISDSPPGVYLMVIRKRQQQFTFKILKTL